MESSQKKEEEGKIKNDESIVASYIYCFFIQTINTSIGKRQKLSVATNFISERERRLTQYFNQEWEQFLIVEHACVKARVV